MKPSSQRIVSRLLIIIFVLSCFSGLTPGLRTVSAQRRVIVVNAEQPNLWTLEQAHYLLAQMHRRNLDLKAKSLEDLDPNEIAGLRFDVMRMLVEFGATFNQADLVSNRLLTANQSFNSERRQQLLDDRSRLSDESVKLGGEIKDLQIQKADTTDADQQKRLDAKITATTDQQARVDKQIQSIDDELKTLNAPSGTPAATTGGATFDASKLPQSTFDKAFQDAAAKQIAKFSDEPRLNASLQLDNFLQMQYEIISKQLSLLRDELGPGERLVFLELPQTINAAHHEADRKWAQSWWKIVGYTHRARVAEADATPTPTPLEYDYQPITVMQDIYSINHGIPINLPLRKPPMPCPSASPATFNYEGADNTSVVRITDKPSSTESSPANIEVSSVPGKITKVTVTLNGLRHRTPADLDLLLVGPQGQNAIIMSGVGAGASANGLDINLDDSALNSLPAKGPISSNPSATFKPTNNSSSPAKFPDDVKPLGGSSLSVFNGTDPNGTWSLYAVDNKGGDKGSLSRGWALNITTQCEEPRPQKQAVYQDAFVNLDNMTTSLPGATPSPTPIPRSELDDYLARDKAHAEQRLVRTVELIPRQSSLNVSDMNLKVKAGALNFVLSTLFGFGSRLSIQRQREQFSQFVQQELYSSAFGKGAREFGWTFTPMPGTDSLQSGVRTTYAVVVVPEDATSLVLEANGCYFPRSYYPPKDFLDTKQDDWNRDERTSRNCDGTTARAFVVPIPSAEAEGSNKFWVEKVGFHAVGKGKQAVVEISGKNFSPQMGVLVNGVPLLQSIGLAQPLIVDDSEAGRRAATDLKDSEIVGRIERIDPNKIIFSLKMPPDFSGTPVITLIAPGRATDINDFDLTVNEKQHTTLSKYTPAMFGFNRPDPFRVDGVRMFRSQTEGHLIAQVSGAGFADGLQALVNGDTNGVVVKVKSPALATVEFPTPKDETIKVTLMSPNGDLKKVKTAESEAVANPAFALSIAEVDVAAVESGDDAEPGTILVKIKGSGFTDSLTASIGDKVFPVAVKSATEAAFTMPDPKGAAIVTLDDGRGHKAKVVVAQEKKPKP